MNKICFGCGSKLQSEDATKEGYIPDAKLKTEDYCQRCFKIIHYGMQSKSSTPKESNIILRSINKDNKFVIFMANFLTINSEVINIFNQITNDKILLISKCDIFLKSIKEIHIKTFLRNYYQIKSDIKLVSSVNNYGVESLTNYLRNRNIHDVYIVGLSNSGKSTLINKLIDLNQSNMKMITTSCIPNTTLDFIRIKINDNLTVIDSPGFIINTIQDDIITSKNNFKVFLKPKTFQIKVGETLEIENMYFNFSEDTSVTLYLINNLKVKKYYKEIDFDNSIVVNNNIDLIISGLGFINIKNRCMIKTANIKPNLLETRISVFGEYYEQD
ncbi:MAG: 50S ribosome-binding GTPase [Bacilli bacterium]|nr:50S ribosome-binding GTPase [Bacilli bacterium]